MSDVAIKVEGLGKQYRLGEIGTGTISHDLNRWWAQLRGKEDPFAKVGEVNDRTAKGNSDYVWSLRDVNFEVKKGEVLGIIGRNGAGKSTLLKILSKVTAPTTGSIKVNGRIASLLEVGTGFHPELTGRENIFLNGAILGMTKSEIRSKFDEIVDFSGVERYIDTPVKRYSSGMYVRLAFAVSAFLEPEILIVDEVLAVGDAEFQKKCLGRMKDVSVNDGRTVLFVSHNMTAVKQLCTQGIILKNGSLEFSGNIISAVDCYNNVQDGNQMSVKRFQNKQNPLFDVQKISVNDKEFSPIIIDSSFIEIKIVGKCYVKIELNIEIRIYNSENTLLCFYGPGNIDGILEVVNIGDFLFEEKVYFPKNISNGVYYLAVSFTRPNVEYYAEFVGIQIIKEGLKTVTGLPLDSNQVGYFLMEK